MGTITLILMYVIKSSKDNRGSCLYTSGLGPRLHD